MLHLLAPAWRHLSHAFAGMSSDADCMGLSNRRRSVVAQLGAALAEGHDLMPSGVALQLVHMSCAGDCVISR